MHSLIDEKTVNHIQMIPPNKATGETREVYRYLAEIAGSGNKVLKIVQVFSLRAGSMRRMIRLWELGIDARHKAFKSLCFRQIQ